MSQLEQANLLLTSTLIDIIVTKASDAKTIASGVINLGIRDHDLTYVCRKVAIPRAEPKFVELDNSSTSMKEISKGFSTHLKIYTFNSDLILHGRMEEFFLQTADECTMPIQKGQK